MITDANRTIDLMFRSLDLTMRSTTTVMDIVAAMAAALDENSELKFLNDHVVNRGGQLRTISCMPEHLPEIMSELNKRGVRVHSFDGLSLDGTQIVTYRDIDERDVISTINEIRSRHHIGGTVAEATLRHGAKDQVIMLKNLDRYDLKMVMEIAKKENLQMCYRGRGQDDYIIYFKQSNKEALRTIERTLAVQKANPIAYKAIKKQIDYEMKHEIDLVYKVLSRKEINPYYISDANGTTLNVTVEGISFEDPKNNINMNVHFQDAGSKNDITMMIASMDNPQVFSLQEYEEYKASGFNKQLLYAKDKESGRPPFTKEEIGEFRKLEKIKEAENLQLIEAKLSMENPEREFYDYSYLNNEMRIQTFLEFEELNEDMLEERNAEYAIDEATLDEMGDIYLDMVHDESEGTFNDIQYGDYERSTPDLERQIESMIDNTYDFEKEYRRDLQEEQLENDLNNNYFPDHFE